MKKLLKKIFIVLILCILLGIVATKLSFRIRNMMATKWISSFTIIEDMLKENAYLKEVGYNDIHIAPSFSVLWAKMNKSMPYYLWTVDIELIKDCRSRPEEGCEKMKKAKAQISLYNSPTQNQPLSYTMSLMVDGQTNDTFGTYPNRSVDLE